MSTESKKEGTAGEGPVCTPYYLKRVVSFACHMMRRGCDKPAVIEAGARHKPPYPAEWIELAWPHVIIACANVDAYNKAPGSARLCDIIQIPPKL